MSWMRFTALAALSFGICLAQSPTFSGLWRLNTARSHWGEKQVPASVTVEITQQGESLKYSGAVMNALGDERQFEFAGACDGKEYPTVRETGPGKVTVQRLTPFVLLVTFRSDDGSITETSRMALSRDGRTLTSQIRVSRPGRDMRWTEVYEKQ
jgi:hypothetical protein